MLSFISFISKQFGTNGIIVLALYLLLFLINYKIYNSVSTEQFKYCLRISQNFVPVVFISVITFICFTQINIKYNKWINSIASASFAVYLLHDNEYIRNFIFKDLLKTDYFYNTNGLILILHIIFSVIFTYTEAYIIERIRVIIIEKLLIKNEKGEQL